MLDSGLDQGADKLLTKRATAEPGPFDFTAVQPIAAEASDGDTSIGGAVAPGRCREALERAMVRTSFIIFVENNAVHDGAAHTIERSAITV